MYELLHEMPNYLRILGNDEMLRLFTWVFIDWMILELVDLNSWIWTRTFEFQLVILSLQLITRNL